MDTAIMNLDKLYPYLGPKSILGIEDMAEQYLKNDNIRFEVIIATMEGLTIHTTQSENDSDSYFTSAALINKTKDEFKEFLPDHRIHVLPFPYRYSIVDIVSPEWLELKMKSKNVRIKDLEIDTGIGKASLSAWVNGLRPMSKPVKAMFYFYLTRK